MFSDFTFSEGDPRASVTLHFVLEDVEVFISERKRVYSTLVGAVTLGMCLRAVSVLVWMEPVSSMPACLPTILCTNTQPQCPKAAVPLPTLCPGKEEGGQCPG